MIGLILVIGTMLIMIAFIAWKWVEGIDFMQNNHPDYKGDDLFGKFDDDEDASQYY